MRIKAYSIIILLLLLTGAKAGRNITTNSIIGNLYGDVPVRITNPKLHGLNGWQGVDTVVGCGTPLYAPIAGKVTHNGLDGYRHNGVYPENTMLTIKSPTAAVTLLHGDYAVPVGKNVLQGDLVGFSASHGWSTGCHEHVIYKVGGVTVNPLHVGKKPLLVTWYNPTLGGINCWGNCTHFRDGTRVTAASYGNTAACIPDWLGDTVVIPRLGTFKCRDTGGAIVEKAHAIHIDLLTTVEPACNLCYYYTYEHIQR